jgi:hypothetical protein
MELLTPEDKKFLRLGLDPAAKGGEITKSAMHFFEGLRNRGVTSYDIEKLIENAGGSDSTLSRADWGLCKMVWPRHPYHGREFRDIPVSRLRKDLAWINSDPTRKIKWTNFAHEIEQWFRQCGETV